LRDKIDHLDDRVQGLERAQIRSEARQDARLEGLEKGYDRLIVKIDSLRAHTDAAHEVLAGKVDEWAARIDSRLDRFSSEIGELRGGNIRAKWIIGLLVAAGIAAAGWIVSHP
jgi:uncharacterized protein (DUF885 family)